MKKLLTTLSIIAIAIAAMTSMAFAQNDNESDTVADLTIADMTYIDAEDAPGLEGIGVQLQLGGNIPAANNQDGGEFDPNTGNFTTATTLTPIPFKYSTNIASKLTMQVTDNYEALQSSQTVLSVVPTSPGADIKDTEYSLSDQVETVSQVIPAGTVEHNGGFKYYFKPADENIMPAPDHFQVTITYTLENEIDD